MAKSRKRVHATRRAADGSAFKKCDKCGVSVAVALADMHECEESRKKVKRFRGCCGILKSNYVAEESTADQPRSAFCFFMESFLRNSEGIHSIDFEREGFKKWKGMSVKERRPYIIQEQKINSIHQEALLREINDASEMEDEADSATVGKFDLLPFYEDYEDDDHDSGSFEAFPSFDTYEWRMVCSWVVKKPKAED